MSDTATAAAPAAPAAPAAAPAAPAAPATSVPSAGQQGANPTTTPAGQQGTPTPSGEKVAGWRDALYGEISSLPDDEKQKAKTWIDRYTTGGDFMKAQMSLRDSFDKRSPVPNDKSKPEEWHEHFVKLGKPEKAEGYKITRPEGAKVEAWEQEAEKSFFTAAHEAHLTQEQVQKMFNWNEQIKGVQHDALIRSMNKYRADAETELRKEWGGDYDGNLSAANSAIRHGFGETFKDFGDLKIEGTGQRIADHPLFARAMAKFGREYGEDIKANGMAQGSASAGLDEKIEAIKREALDKGKLPSDPEYHARLQPLYEARYGNRKISPTTGPFSRRA